MVLKTNRWAKIVGDIFEETMMNCEIRVYLPSDQDDTPGNYDPETDTWSAPVSETTVYQGVARIQVLRSAERSVAPGDDSKTQMYQFQIPWPGADITDEHEVKVTDGGLNTFLTGRTFYVINNDNSGGSFEQTFFATTNSGRP